MNDDRDVARLSPRKREIRSFYERIAASRDAWIDRRPDFHAAEWRYMRFLVPKGLRVLDLGCGTGRLLAELEPASGTGVDISPAMIDIARRRFPHLSFVVGDVEDPQVLASLGGPFDVIILSDTIGTLEDCQATLERIHTLSTPETRVIIVYYNQLWRPILWLAEQLGLKMPDPAKNWLSLDDLRSLFVLTEYEVVRHEWRQMLPLRLFGIADYLNAILGSLPGIRRLCLRNYLVARPLRNPGLSPLSASVVIPCRNERGNIEPAITRMPRFCEGQEIIFVEGHSTDGTHEECLRVQAAYPHWDIKVTRQEGQGKKDAVLKGFRMAAGEVLIILDADLTVPPEMMPKFYQAIISGKGNFVNGTRLVYPMESGAMRPLNYLANRAFAILFSWLLGQRFTDTLCGTKALTKTHFRRIEDGQVYFGNLDPFGDFDLIFGAAKLNLKMIEIPVRYTDRLYGNTNISRFRHGWLLVRMLLLAFRKLKAV